MKEFNTNPDDLPPAESDSLPLEILDADQRPDKQQEAATERINENAQDPAEVFNDGGAGDGGGKEPPTGGENTPDNGDDDDHEGPKKPETLEAIALRCRTYMKECEDDFKSRLDAGDVTQEESDFMLHIFTGLAREAAAEENLPKVNMYVDMATKLAETSKVKAAAIFYHGIGVGSEQAQDSLNTLLSTEQQEGLDPTLPPGSSALEGVIQACEEEGKAPDAWINRYARDTSHAWSLQIEHYMRLAESNNEHTDFHREQCDIKAAELLDEGKHSEEFAHHHTLEALQITNNPEIRHRLIDSFKQRRLGMPLSPGTINYYANIGQHVLSHTELATEENIQFLELNIGTLCDLAKIHGQDPVGIDMEQMHWKASLRMHQTGSAEAAIQAIDESTFELLQHDMPDDKDADNTLRNRASVIDIRDYALEFQGRRCLRRGNFADAQKFVSAIGGGLAKMDATNVCLEDAKTPDQVAAFKPDELTLAVDPAINLAFQVAEARADGDLDRLEAIARENAQAYAEPTEELRLPRYRAIERTYKAVRQQDHRRATALAKELLTMVRGTGVEPSLTEILLREGDPEETRLAYEKIMRQKPSPSKLFRVWKIAYYIEQQSRH